MKSLSDINSDLWFDLFVDWAGIFCCMFTESVDLGVASIRVNGETTAATLTENTPFSFVFDISVTKVVAQSPSVSSNCCVPEVFHWHGQRREPENDFCPRTKFGNTYR